MERDKLNQERELLLLRPLKNQLQTFSESNQQTIEQNVRNEFEKNKLQKELMDLQNNHDRVTADN